MAKECPHKIGDRSGQLTIIGKELRSTLEGDRARRRTYLQVECDCGTIKWIRAIDLGPRNIVSCGCHRRSLDGRSGTVAHKLLKGVKQRARLHNLPCDITIDDIIIPDECPLLGTKLVHHDKPGCYPDSPSVDRKVPKLGYVRGNVWVISGLANRIKTNATPEQIMLLATNLKEHLC